MIIRAQTLRDLGLGPRQGDDGLDGLKGRGILPGQEPVDGFPENLFIPSCSLSTINNPVEASGGGDQFLVIF
jgi:hypothetical protein